MSGSHSGYSFPGGSYTGGGYTAPSAASPSAGSTPRVICPGEGTRFPPVDDHLIPLETREEMVDGVRMETLPADPAHGDSHAWLTAALVPLLRPGLVPSVDMQTRFSVGDNFAPDISIRRAGLDPETQRRYLEELAVEIGNSQTRAKLENKARAMARRGVRRILVVLVPEEQVWDWGPAEQRLRLINASGSIEDPTLVTALPVSLLLLIVRGALEQTSPEQVQAALKDFLAESLVTQKNPIIQREAHKGEQRGELRGAAQMLLRVLERRGVPVDELSRRRILACPDLDTLQRWMDNALTAPTIADVLA